MDGVSHNVEFKALCSKVCVANFGSSIFVGLRDDNDARKARKAHSGEGPNWAS
jgi:hypothetical protein